MGEGRKEVLLLLTAKRNIVMSKTIVRKEEQITDEMIIRSSEFVSYNVFAEGRKMGFGSLDLAQKYADKHNSEVKVENGTSETVSDENGTIHFATSDLALKCAERQTCPTIVAELSNGTWFIMRDDKRSSLPQEAQ